MRHIKPITNALRGRAESVLLFRQMQKELPRVLALYDIHMPLPKARAAIRVQFDNNKNVKDPRIVNILVSKCVYLWACIVAIFILLTSRLTIHRGQQEMEETLLQYKQKSQLMRYLEPMSVADSFQLDAEFAGDDNTRFFQGIEYKGHM